MTEECEEITITAGKKGHCELHAHGLAPQAVPYRPEA